MLALCREHPNLLVPHWLIASFMYYIEDAPLLSDAAFDEIVRELAKRWETIEHRHKHLIDPALMKSGFYLTVDQYPEIVKGAASLLRSKLRKGRRTP